MIRGRTSDAEWAFFEPFLIETGPKRDRPPNDHRRVLDGICESACNFDPLSG